MAETNAQTWSEKAEIIRRISDGAVPHFKAIGAELLFIDHARGVMRLPYREDLIGNVENGVLHGGVITTLMDSVCGLAVFAALERLTPIATLDLRIDYLRPATPGLALLAEAHCYKVTRHVAFVRGMSYHEHPGDPVAHSAGTFMIGTAGNKAREKRGDAR